jgi:hypothetical protein
MHLWKATIKIAGVGQQNITVRADTQWAALRMIESQYGKGCIVGSRPMYMNG